MSGEIGWTTLGVIPSFKGFESALSRETSGPLAKVGAQGGVQFGDAAGRSAGKRFGGVFGKLAKASLIGAAGLGVAAIKIAGDSISAASDLAESTNKVQQVFGDASGNVFKFTKRAGDAFGQTNTQAREAAATFGIFGRVAGLTDRKNAKFSIRMTKLASDLASFNNTSPEQAIEALGAALRGESEPIRSYGVLLDEATLKAEALRMGLLEPVKDQAKIKSYQVAILEGQKKYNEAVKEYGEESLEALKAEANLGTARDRLRKATEGTIPALTQQQKVLAAQSSIMRQTTIQQGDFARTSDGLANRQRRLSAEWENAKASLGEALLPAMESFVGFVLDNGIPAVRRFSGWFKDDAVPALQDFGAWFRDEGIPAIKDFGDEMQPAVDMAKDLAGFLGGLPGKAKLAGVLALIGGAGAMKVRGGKGGALGLAGQAIGLAKPIKVFETNPAALGKGGGVGGAAGGKAKWLLTAGSVGITVAGATAVSFAATKAIIDLQKKVAPDAADKGIAGTPRNAGFDGLFGEDGLDGAKAEDKLGVIENAFYGVRNAVLGTAADVGLLGDDIKALPPAKIDFQMPGFSALMTDLGRVREEIDWITKPREARITITQRYAGDPSRTAPGLQEYGGGPVQYIHNGNIVANNPRDYERWRRRRAARAAGGGVNY